MPFCEVNRDTFPRAFLYCIWVGSIDASGSSKGWAMVWRRCCRQNLRQQLSLSADRAIFYFGVTVKALWTGSNLATILTMCLRLELGWV